MQWTPVVASTLGPENLVCDVETLLCQGCIDNSMQGRFEIWDHGRYFIVIRVCYIIVCYSGSPLYVCLYIAFCLNDCHQVYFHKMICMRIEIELSDM